MQADGVLGIRAIFTTNLFPGNSMFAEWGIKLLDGIMLLTAAILMAAFGIFYFTGNCKIRKRKIQEQNRLVSGKRQDERWESSEGKEKTERHILMFKSSATLIPALLALFAAFSEWTSFAWFIAAASFYCVAADYFLETRFKAGVALFGLGHVCYLAAYLQITDITSFSLGVFILLYGAMFLFHGRYLKEFGTFKPSAFAYAALLSAMTAMALTVGAESGGRPGLVIAVGGIFFYLSDNILVRTMLTGRRENRHGAVLLALYYLAVYLIAASSFL